MIEYPTLQEARAAIDGANQTKLLEQTINVDFAFVRPPPGKGGNSGNNNNSKGAGGGGRQSLRGGRNGRSRSRSPDASKDRDEEA